MNALQYLPRFRNAYRALNQLALLENWSRADIESLQLERLNQVWEHAIRFVPHYRQLAESRSFPNRFQSLDEYAAVVPVFRKEEMRARQRDFLSQRRQKGSWKCTSGSTGNPVPVYWSHAAYREVLQARYRFYHMWGVDIFDRTIYLWGNFNSFAPGLSGSLARWRQPVEDRLRNRQRLSAYRLHGAALREHLLRIKSFKPKFRNLDF